MLFNRPGPGCKKRTNELNDLPNNRAEHASVLDKQVDRKKHGRRVRYVA